MGFGQQLSKSDQRIIELDGLRGIAVLMVLAWHFIGSMAPVYTGTVPDLIYASTVFGRTGVDLFFVLSGFLIIGILLDNRAATNHFRVFYTRRICRIWPPYVALMIVYWGCFLLLGQSVVFNTHPTFPIQFLSQLTFNFGTLMVIANGAVARAFSVTWSVGIEEWFYLIFPFFIFLMPLRALPWFLGAAAIFSVIARPIVSLTFHHYWLAPYQLLPLRLDALCVGGLIAIAYRSQKAMAWMEARRTAIGRGAVIFAAATPFVIGAVYRDVTIQSYYWGHTYLSLGYGLLLVAILLFRNSRATAVFRHILPRQAARYSYTIYLFHPLFISLFFLLAGRRREVVTSWADAGLALAAFLSAVAFSVIFYFVFERRFLALGHRAKYRFEDGHPVDEETPLVPAIPS